tara:strand:+ start:268 stop:444 length:177 start_codon:yes stop_codon:yes gene_type:complete
MIIQSQYNIETLTTKFLIQVNDKEMFERGYRPQDFSTPRPEAVVGMLYQMLRSYMEDS